MPNLIKYTPLSVDQFLENLRTGASDDVKLTIRHGVAKATIKRANGQIQNATAMLGGRFQSRTSFDATEVTSTKRRKLVGQLRKEGLRQTAIADLLGVSQATVSQDLKKIKAAKTAS